MASYEALSNTVFHQARDAVLSLIAQLGELVEDQAGIDYGFGSCNIELVSKGWLRIPRNRRESALEFVMSAMGAPNPQGWARFLSAQMESTPDEVAISTGWPYEIPLAAQDEAFLALPNQLDFDRIIFMLGAAKGVALAKKVQESRSVWYYVASMRCFLGGVTPNPFNAALGMRPTIQGGRWI